LVIWGTCHYIHPAQKVQGDLMPFSSDYVEKYFEPDLFNSFLICFISAVSVAAFASGGTATVLISSLSLVVLQEARRGAVAM
jgi:hypothetical protein